MSQCLRFCFSKSIMMTLPKIIFLFLVVGGSCVPHLYVDVETRNKPTRFDGPSSQDIAERDKKVSITRLANSDVVFLDPCKRGMPAIEKIADASYNKLLFKTPIVNYQKTFVNPSVNYPTYQPGYVGSSQVLVGGAITLPNVNFQLASPQPNPWERFSNLFKQPSTYKQNDCVVKCVSVSDPKVEVKHSSQIDPVPAFSAEFVPTHRPLDMMKKNQSPVLINPLLEALYKQITSMSSYAQLSRSDFFTMAEKFVKNSNVNNNKNQFGGTQQSQYSVNWQDFITPSMIQNFSASFISSGNPEITSVNAGNESPKPVEQQDITKMMRPKIEELPQADGPLETTKENQPQVLTNPLLENIYIQMTSMAPYAHLSRSEFITMVMEFMKNLSANKNNGEFANIQQLQNLTNWQDFITPSMVQHFLASFISSGNSEITLVNAGNESPKPVEQQDITKMMRPKIEDLPQADGPLETTKENQPQVLTNPLLENIYVQMTSMTPYAHLSRSEFITMFMEFMKNLSANKNNGEFANIQQLQYLTNWQDFITPSMVQQFFATFINPGNQEYTLVNAGNESPKPVEQQDITKMMRPKMEDLPQADRPLETMEGNQQQILTNPLLENFYVQITSMAPYAHLSRSEFITMFEKFVKNLSANNNKVQFDETQHSQYSINWQDFITPSMIQNFFASFISSENPELTSVNSGNGPLKSVEEQDVTTTMRPKVEELPQADGPLETTKENQPEVLTNPLLENIYIQMTSMTPYAHLSRSEFITMFMEFMKKLSANKNNGEFANIQQLQYLTNWQDFITPSMVQHFLASFISSGNSEITLVNAGNESPKPVEQQDITKMMRPKMEDLPQADGPLETTKENQPQVLTHPLLENIYIQMTSMAPYAHLSRSEFITMFMEFMKNLSANKNNGEFANIQQLQYLTNWQDFITPSMVEHFFATLINPGNQEYTSVNAGNESPKPVEQQDITKMMRPKIEDLPQADRPLETMEGNQQQILTNPLLENFYVQITSMAPYAHLSRSEFITMFEKFVKNLSANNNKVQFDETQHSQYSINWQDFITPSMIQNFFASFIGSGNSEITSVNSGNGPLKSVEEQDVTTTMRPKIEDLPQADRPLETTEENQPQVLTNPLLENIYIQITSMAPYAHLSRSEFVTMFMEFIKNLSANKNNGEFANIQQLQYLTNWQDFITPSMVQHFFATFINSGNQEYTLVNAGNESPKPVEQQDVTKMMRPKIEELPQADGPLETTKENQPQAMTNPLLENIYIQMTSMTPYAHLSRSEFITMFMEFMKNLSANKNNGIFGGNQQFQYSINWQDFITPSMIQNFLATFVNLGSASVNADNEQLKSVEGQDVTTTMRPTYEETTEDPTLGSSYENKITFSTTQVRSPETDKAVSVQGHLGFFPSIYRNADKSAEMTKHNYHVMFKQPTTSIQVGSSLNNGGSNRGGLSFLSTKDELPELGELTLNEGEKRTSPSTFGDANKSSNINKDDFYVMFKQPTTSIQVGSSVDNGPAVALNGSKIKDVKITEVQAQDKDCDDKRNVVLKD